MTLTVAWERPTSAGSELVFASDSRLRSNGAWDVGPKIFRLPRSDALLAFAGETLWAYPIALQTIAAMDANESSRSRAHDLSGAVKLTIRSMNAMMTSGSAVTNSWRDIELEFLLGGWSWREQRFRLWRIYWSRGARQMHSEPIGSDAVGRIRFIGTWDRHHQDPSMKVVSAAKARLSARLRGQRRLPWSSLGPLDMEPWHVLVEMLRSGSFPAIGGPPQLAKVFTHMDTQTFAVRWPDRNGRRALMGRFLLDGERTDAPEVDPDNPEAAAQV